METLSGTALRVPWPTRHPRLVQTDRGLVEVDPTHCPNGHELEGNMLDESKSAGYRKRWALHPRCMPGTSAYHCHYAVVIKGMGTRQRTFVTGFA
jgi:hypothetical protein